MTTAARRSQPAKQPTLAREFGCRSAVARESVARLAAALMATDASPAEASFRAWKVLWDDFRGPLSARSQNAAKQLAATYAIVDRQISFDRLLFSLHTYFAMLVRLAVPESASTPESGDLFAWPEESKNPDLAALIKKLRARLPPSRLDGCARPAEGNDIFKDLYQSLFPTGVRRVLGEFYTPDWLAEHVLDELGYAGNLSQRLLDPACGSGTFLMAAIRRIRANARQRSRVSGQQLARRIAQSVAGIDRNPLAVLSARANYLLAIRDLLNGEAAPEIPVFAGDSILGSGLPLSNLSDTFDLIAGNPPWQVWDVLPPHYRALTLPLWQRYGLFTLSAAAARHGGGKKDLSMLMLYASADRYLKTGGKLGFVMNQTILQTQAGEGFRRFQIGAAGPPLRALKVNDMVRFQPFAGASNWTSTLIVQKGQPTQYPLPYVCWSRRELPSSPPSTGESAYELQQCQAQPIDASRRDSPWQIRPVDGPSVPTSPAGPSDYAAHLGANTGGANGVYWVRVLKRRGTHVLLENLAERGKSAVESMRFEAEAELVHPMLRWRDVSRFHAAPSAHILLAQDPQTRSGIEAERMQSRYPLAWDYLRRFEPLLTARAAYRRYQAAGPAWSMYNVGDYTLAPIKVVWRRMDRRLNAAVIEMHDDPILGPRPVVPQETCVLMAVATSDEAHYLCALLNSAPVDEAVRSHSVRGGKGFGTPGMLNYLAIRKFDRQNDSHRALARLSRQAHSSAGAGDAQAAAVLQTEIDRRAEQLRQERA